MAAKADGLQEQEMTDAPPTGSREAEMSAALKPWKEWCAACMEAAPLAPDELVWAGYGPTAITMGDMRMMYFLASALSARGETK